MNAEEIKLHILEYFRYKRNMICCSEVYHCNWIADIQALDATKKILYEIEIKITIADLKKEKTDKKLKHNRIALRNKDITYFYFAVPDTIFDKAKPLIEDLSNKYGIISIDCNGGITIKKRGKKIANNIDEETLKRLALRSSSEVCLIRRKIYELGR